MLFNASSGDRYDGLVTAIFEDGKLTEVRANNSTDDISWVEFIWDIVNGMSALYPDSGKDGLSGLAEQFFLPDAKRYFWKALAVAGITDDRSAVRHCKDKNTVIPLVSMLRYLICIDK